MIPIPGLSSSNLDTGSVVSNLSNRQPTVVTVSPVAPVQNISGILTTLNQGPPSNGGFPLSIRKGLTFTEPRRNIFLGARQPVAVGSPSNNNLTMLLILGGLAWVGFQVLKK